ncbi:MAG: hypothetical protein JSS53_04430 [Proteobacteria bacterium]|nr:hypothetical protein [Pseudomonadota bacterium]
MKFKKTLSLILMTASLGISSEVFSEQLIGCKQLMDKSNNIYKTAVFTYYQGFGHQMNGASIASCSEETNHQLTVSIKIGDKVNPLPWAITITKEGVVSPPLSAPVH